MRGQIHHRQGKTEWARQSPFPAPTPAHVRYWNRKSMADCSRGIQSPATRTNPKTESTVRQIVLTDPQRLQGIHRQEAKRNLLMVREAQETDQFVIPRRSRNCNSQRGNKTTGSGFLFFFPFSNQLINFETYCDDHAPRKFGFPFIKIRFQSRQRGVVD